MKPTRVSTPLAIILSIAAAAALGAQEPAAQEGTTAGADAPMEAPAPADHLTDLPDGDLGALAERFDADVGKARILIILSPGCGACRVGARIVEEQLGAGLAGQDGVRVYVVWTAALEGDDREDALRAGASLVDPRIHQYWEPAGALGHAYGTYIPLPDDDDFAWDVYLLYHRLARWGDAVPPFLEWWHKFADDERTLDGEDLCSEVATLIGLDDGCESPE